MFAFFVRGSFLCVFFAARINSFLSRFCERKSKIEFHVLPFSFFHFLLSFSTLSSYTFSTVLAKGCEITCLLESSDCCLTLHTECSELNIDGSTQPHDCSWLRLLNKRSLFHMNCWTSHQLHLKMCIATYNSSLVQHK